MNITLKTLLLDKVGNELNQKGYYLAKTTNTYAVYHRKNKKHIEIIQWTKDKHETYITISASIVFLDTIAEKSNIDFKMFNEFNNGDYNKISVDDCIKKYFLKNRWSYKFHYGDVYLAFGLGIIGTLQNNQNKHLGIRIKKYKNSTYNNLCNLIIKKLNKVYFWLDKQKII